MGSCHCRRWCNLQKEATLGLMEPLHESIGRAAGVCSSPSSRGKLEVACAESLWRNGLATSVNDHGFAAEGHAVTNLASNRRLIWNSRSWPKHIASRQSQGKLLLCSASFTFPVNLRDSYIFCNRKHEPKTPLSYLASNRIYNWNRYGRSRSVSLSLAQLSFERCADLSHTQIYLLERYMWPIIISEQTLSYSPIEISVDFLKRRPTSVLELIIKENAGVKHKSSQIKEGELVHWNINTFVRLR